jgi:Glycosyl hydrolases family 18/Fibronectin type III domain
MAARLRLLVCSLLLVLLASVPPGGAAAARPARAQPASALAAVQVAGDRPPVGGGQRPTVPPGGHDVTRPGIERRLADGLTPAVIGPLPPRTPVAALTPRSASLAPRTAGPGGLQREVFGFAVAGALGDPNVGYTTWNFSLLSTVAFFSLGVNPGDGSLDQTTTGWAVWHSGIASAFINAAHASGVRVVLTVDYITGGATNGTMCSALDHGQTTIGQLAGQLMGADGVNIDYEGQNQTCPDGVALRTKVVQFARAVRAQIPGYLTIDTYASSAEDAGGFFDIPSLAGTVDAFFVMEYGLEGPNGPCATCMGPTSPLAGDPTYVWNVTRSANGYLPWAAQSILGFPYYGVKACVNGPNPPANAPVVPGTYGADTYLTIKSYPADPKIGSFQEQRDGLDPAGQEAWATFFSGYTNCWREEYFDDDVSLGRKYDLVNRLDFRGAGMFTLDYGGASPELWNALQTHFALLPAAPANVRACPGNGFANVAWDAAASASPLLGYTVTANPGNVSVGVPGNATQVTFPRLDNGTSYRFSVRAANGFGAGPSAPSGAVVPALPAGSWPGRLHPLAPARILDTRIGLGLAFRLGPAARADLPVLGQGGIPASGVSAVVMNFTVAGGSAGSYLSFAASGACVAGFSNLNFQVNQQAANLAVVPVAANGSISIYNSQGSVDVIGDVFGWIGGAGDTGPDGHFQPVSPTRVLDTRSRTQGVGTLGPNQTVRVAVAGQNGLPASGISAVVLNLTAADATRGSFLSVWPTGQPQPATSNVNFGPAQQVANRVVVPLGPDGAIDLYNSAGSTEAIIDVNGWYTGPAGGVPEGLLTAVTPVRVVDTRIGLGAPVGQLGQGQWLTVQVSGQPGLPAIYTHGTSGTGISGVVVSLTTTGSTRSSYLEVNGSGTFTNTSDLNFAAGQTIANVVVSPVDSRGRIYVYNSAGATDVIVDLLGWY